MENKNHTKKLVITSMMAALTFVITASVVIPVPGTRAIVNLGDSVIYCTGLLLGAPWAAAAAGIGSAIADWVVGVPIYIPATLIIKGLMGFVCGAMMRNARLPRFIITAIIAGAIMVAGYFVYDFTLMMLGNPTYQEVLSQGLGYAIPVLIVPNLIQYAGGITLAVVLYYPVKRIKVMLK